ncbi:AraC family transcriptional regulator [Neptunomonas antarctica]|uniref:AraC-type DNA-binding protein n=1 Tax=Neptunomonas antarctica TaxID=619304 RepID=A0A1N7LI83_9GAMM|nr:AraC family transcriptional regulator ligand-binding domain-containing protein [Neptunomonas antarctica]SIS73517.1 AraC-type DNA-binding protein [Neptunomonas antarctica]
MSVITASAKLLEPVLQLAQHYRLEPSQIFNSAALSHADFTKPGARFPATHFNDVLHTLAEAADNPRIALNLGEATQPRILGSIGFMMSTAPTLGKAYQTLIDYLPLLFEGAVLQMEQTVEGTLLTLELNEPNLQPIEYFLACLVNWPRWLTGQQIPASVVYLSFPEPENIQTYQRFFAAEVQFDAPRNQLLLASDYLTLSCIDANPEMHQLHREFADSLLSKSNQQSALVAQTRNLIRRQLSEGGGTVRREQIADTLGLSLRTLQRKLGVLGTNFQDVYDHTRREVGLQLIQRGQLSFGEIAFQLGFSNQSAFQKAFKRWMGVAPSAYRQQIKPVVFSDPVTLPDLKQPSNAWLAGDNATQLIEQKIGSLNSFSLELLECAALLCSKTSSDISSNKSTHVSSESGHQFDLTELSLVTDNPVARVAIHLWSAEESGLIATAIKKSSVTVTAINHDIKDDQAGYFFTDTAVLNALNQRMSDAEKTQRHTLIGLAMLRTLPLKTLPLKTLAHPLSVSKAPLVQTTIAQPTLIHTILTQPTLAEITPALFHLNLALSLADAEEASSLLASINLSIHSYLKTNLHLLNMMAADQAEQQHDYQSADVFLTEAGRHLNDSELSLKTDLLLHRVRVLLFEGDIETADQCLQQLVTFDMSIQDAINTALMKARVYQQRGMYAQSLDCLLDSWATLDQPLPDDETKQLSQLLVQLTDISKDFTAISLVNMAEMTDSEHLLRLRLLEQISLIARQQSQPLLAACAIGRMTELSLQNGLSPLTAFAFVSYAWVSSWFSADYALARTFSAQGMQLACQLDGITHTDNLSAKTPQGDSAISATLLQSSQVQHWFAPLDSAVKQLVQVDKLATEHSQWLIQSECRLLKHQLLFLSPTPLGEQLLLCREDHQQMLEQTPFHAERLQDSTLILLEQLRGEHLFPTQVNYSNGWQAVSTIIGALLLDQQPIWPELYLWEALLENELAGYFCVSEALFCTAMMRLIHAQQQHVIGRFRRIEIDQIESRMELWAHHCPDNFKGQLVLLQAEKSRLLEHEQRAIKSTYQAPDLLFEEAIQLAEKNDFGYHKALCYERYSDYLVTKKQLSLARFCLNEACSLYQHWGASAKVKQLEHRQVLLAK